MRGRVLESLRRGGGGRGSAAVCASVVYAPAPEDVVERFRALRVSSPDDVTLYAGGSGVAGMAESLEQLGVLCPRSVGDLRSELAAQASSGGA